MHDSTLIQFLYGPVWPSPGGQFFDEDVQAFADAFHTYAPGKIRIPFVLVTYY